MGLDDADLRAALSRDDLDSFAFGVILLDRQLTVTGYNRAESELSGLEPASVLGRRLFTEVAPCMNTTQIAGRFDATTEHDETFDYMLSVRMRMTPVRIRILNDPSHDLRALCIEKKAP